VLRGSVGMGTLKVRLASKREQRRALEER